MSQILIVSNEQSTSGILTTLLKTEGYKVTRAGNISHAQELIETDQFNLMVITCSKDWDPDLTVIQTAHRAQAAMPVISITEISDSETEARLATMSIFARIAKPLKVDQLLAEVQRAVDYNDEALAKVANVNLQLETLYQYEGVIAESPSMKSVCDIIDRIAGIDVAVLIKGDSGVGKGSIAKAIHANSNRSDMEMITVDCAGDDVESEIFGSGKDDNCFKKAEKTSLFLKNIDKLPAGLQEKLATALTDREMPVVGENDPTPFSSRMISSTVVDLDEAVAKGSFNESLLKQLKTIVVKVPALREREADILPTIKSVIQNLSSEVENMPAVNAGAMTALEKYSWPGNIAEIESVLRSAVQNASDQGITEESLPSEVRV